MFGATARGIAFDPLLSQNGAQYDASKFSWIGSANNEVSVCVALTTSGITTFDELFTKPLTIGSTGIADDTYQFPAVVNAVLGTKFKIITGYPGGNDVSLAHRARRGRRPLRLVVVEPRDDTADLGRDQEDRRPGADVAGETSRTA